MAKAKLKELHKREIKPISKNKRKNVYTNGIDDNYPERIDLLINNSTTAKLAVNKMVSFIVGKGFEDESLNTKIFNVKKGLTGYDLLVACATSLVKQKAITMHVNFNGLLEPNYLDVLPFKNCRKEKDDDIGNSGIWYYSESWGNTGFSYNKKNNNAKWYYPYSRSESVLKSQFKKEDIDLVEVLKSEAYSHTFRGQVAYLNLEPEYIYPLSFIDPAYNDADSEYHSSLNRNNVIKNGYSDKSIVFAREESEENEGYTIEDTISDMVGSDGANIGLQYVSADVEDLTKEVHVVTLGSEVNAERYRYFDEVNERKILQCFENLPEALVLSRDSSLLGDGGLKLRELKLNYSQDTEYIRVRLSQFLKKIYPKYDWSIKPLIEQQQEILK